MALGNIALDFRARAKQEILENGCDAGDADLYDECLQRATVKLFQAAPSVEVIGQLFCAYYGGYIPMFPGVYGNGNVDAALVRLCRVGFLPVGGGSALLRSPTSKPYVEGFLLASRAETLCDRLDLRADLVYCMQTSAGVYRTNAPNREGYAVQTLADGTPVARLWNSGAGAVPWYEYLDGLSFPSSTVQLLHDHAYIWVATRDFGAAVEPWAVVLNHLNSG